MKCLKIWMKITFADEETASTERWEDKWKGCHMIHFFIETHHSRHWRFNWHIYEMTACCVSSSSCGLQVGDGLTHFELTVICQQLLYAIKRCYLTKHRNMCRGCWPSPCRFCVWVSQFFLYLTLDPYFLSVLVWCLCLWLQRPIWDRKAWGSGIKAG